MIWYSAQLGPIIEATKTALTADQINLMLVVIVFVVAAQTIQAWRYSASIDKFRGSVDIGFNMNRTDQRDGNQNVSKLAETVETFSGRMVEITEGFAKRMNVLGQQMDAGFSATASVIDGMRVRFDDADKTASFRNEQVITAVRDAGDHVIDDVSRHVDGGLDKLAAAVAGSLDGSAASVRQSVGEGVDSVLLRHDKQDAELGTLRETAAQIAALWGGVDSKLSTLRDEMVGKHELDALAGQLGEILIEIRKVKNVQPQILEVAADVAGSLVAGGAAAGDGHSSPVGRPDASGDLVLHQHADGEPSSAG